MDLFEQAVLFATERHGGQIRKRGNLPYILHPIEVATIVSTMSNDRELLAAAVLHDTVEDTDTTIEEIREKFGKRVALLVMTETEDKRENQRPEDTWQTRKEETLAVLENTKDLDVKRMWLGDKLSNVRSFARLYRTEGDALWQSFHQKDPKIQAWYYRKILHCLADLHDTDAYKEFLSLCNYIFQNVEEGM